MRVEVVKMKQYLLPTNQNEPDNSLDAWEFALLVLLLDTQQVLLVRGKDDVWIWIALYLSIELLVVLNIVLDPL